MPRGPAFRSRDAHLDQGDIFSDVPLGKWEHGQLVQGPGVRAVITSHGCACEDYERALEGSRSQQAEKILLHVAPLRSARDFPEHRVEEIRSGRYLGSFFIYGQGSVLSDQIVDFTREQPVPAVVLSQCTKIARLADWQWARLLVHLAVSRFHQEPETLFRPELLGGAV